MNDGNFPALHTFMQRRQFGACRANGAPVVLSFGDARSDDPRGATDHLQADNGSCAWYGTRELNVCRQMMCPILGTRFDATTLENQYVGGQECERGDAVSSGQRCVKLCQYREHIGGIGHGTLAHFISRSFCAKCAGADCSTRHQYRQRQREDLDISGHGQDGYEETASGVGTAIRTAVTG
jgi:hypothetical protein